MSRTFYDDRSQGPSQGPRIIAARRGRGRRRLSHMQQMLSKMRFALRRKNRMADYRTGCAALIAFQRIHGHCIIPQFFAVPLHLGPHSAYPAAARGFPLGRFFKYLLNELKDGSNDKALRYIAQLQRRGVAVGSISEARIRRFLSALRIFKQLHGHVQVPASYVVPTNEGAGGSDAEDGSAPFPFPRWLQGLPLGRWAKRLPETQRFVSFLHLLPEFGLEELQEPQRWRLLPAQTVRNVLSALAAFKHIHGHVQVPAAYRMNRRLHREVR